MNRMLILTPCSGIGPDNGWMSEMDRRSEVTLDEESGDELMSVVMVDRCDENVDDTESEIETILA